MAAMAVLCVAVMVLTAGKPDTVDWRLHNGVAILTISDADTLKLTTLDTVMVSTANIDWGYDDSDNAWETNISWYIEEPSGSGDSLSVSIYGSWDLAGTLLTPSALGSRDARGGIGSNGASDDFTFATIVPYLRIIIAGTDTGNFANGYKVHLGFKRGQK